MHLCKSFIALSTFLSILVHGYFALWRTLLTYCLSCSASLASRYLEIASMDVMMVMYWIFGSTRAKLRHLFFTVTECCC